MPDSQIRRSVHLSKRVDSQAVNFSYLMLVFWSDLTHRRRINGPGWHPCSSSRFSLPNGPAFTGGHFSNPTAVLCRVLPRRCAGARSRSCTTTCGPSSTFLSHSIVGQDSCEQLLFVHRRSSANNLDTGSSPGRIRAPRSVFESAASTNRIEESPLRPAPRSASSTLAGPTMVRKLLSSALALNTRAPRKKPYK